MPYYECEKCGAKFAGWGVGKFCQKCRGKLNKISKEEFYRDEEKRNKAIEKAIGLKSTRQRREIFSEEERYIFSKMIETRGGRKQLLEILRGK
ncbi:hypothetical protein ES708_24917 [subsurface metagenome]